MEPFSFARSSDWKKGRLSVAPFSNRCARRATAFSERWSILNCIGRRNRRHKMSASAAYLGDLDMKKFLLASVALIALTGAASAADLAARPYTKAPMMAPVAPSWTGFYIFGGAGGGIWDADSHTNIVGMPATIDQRVGGDGWFGTVG